MSSKLEEARDGLITAARGWRFGTTTAQRLSDCVDRLCEAEAEEADPVRVFVRAARRMWSRGTVAVDHRGASFDEPVVFSDALEAAERALGMKP